MPHPLLQNLIDYAGLFPPASLPLAEAWAHYGRYRAQPEAWLLGNFIIPVGQLSAASELPMPTTGDGGRGTRDPHAKGYPLSVLGQGGMIASDWLHNLTADMAAIIRTHATTPHRALACEVRLPSEVLAKGNAAELSQLIAHGKQILGGIALFVEVPYEGDWAVWGEWLEVATAALSQLNGTVGLKIRCGGVAAHQFPSLRRLATAVLLARDGHIPLKATAGLHHPVRHYHDSVHTHMHGFINLFGGAALAHAHGLSHAQLTAVLGEEDPSAFKLEGGGFQWRHWQIGGEEIGRLRPLLTSYGSCSFDEPCEDLQGLGVVLKDATTP